VKIVSRPSRPLSGSVRPPGDKSISHRAALFAAMAEGRSRLEGILRAGVTRVMLDSLAAAGAEMSWEGGDLVVDGIGRGGFRSAGRPLACGNSATTLRMLAGALAGRPAWQENPPGAEFILDGSEQLRRRPMGRIMAPLAQMGARIRALGRADCAPLAIAPAPLRGIDFRMPVASAQVKSAVLIAGLSGSGPTSVEEPLPSRDHTERLLRHLGVRLAAEGNRVRVHPIDGPLPAFDLRMPGDFSSAAFLIVAATLIRGSEIVLEGVGLNPRRTGLLAVLRRMGARIDVLNRAERAGEPVGDLRVRGAALKAAVVEGGEVVDMIDEFPVFAVAAAAAHGTTVVRQAGELRHKESDRVAALCGELGKIGVPVEESADGFAVCGPAVIRGGAVDSHGDHRLAMALAVAGLASAGGVEIDNAECVAESFPDFQRTLNALGADLG
jgi:3-phosphoshikimate 1-carboxyvinyltransferase